MIRACLSCALFCILIAPAWAQSVTVIGVVVDSKNKERRPNIKVGLYCDVRGKCTLDVEEETRGTGVYALTQSNLGLSKIFIIYDGPPTYSAMPRVVSVTCPADEKRPCILFADDLELMNPPLTNDPTTMAEHLNAVASTQAIKVHAGKTDLKTANEIVAQEVAKNCAFYSANNKKSSDETAMVEIFSALKKTPKINGIPELEIVTKESAFTDIRHRQDFKDYKAIEVDPSLWKKPTSIKPKTLDKILSLPNKDIPANWVDDGKHFDFIRENLKKSADAAPNHTLAVITGDKLGPLRITPDTNLSDKAIRDLLQDHPEMRAWAFYGTINQRVKLTPQQQNQIHDRNRGNRPIVVPLKK